MYLDIILSKNAVPCIIRRLDSLARLSLAHRHKGHLPRTL